MKLYNKIRMLKIKKKLKNKDICEKTGAKLVTVTNWQSEKHSPKSLGMKYALKLVELSDGYITLKDCGH